MSSDRRSPRQRSATQWIGGLSLLMVLTLAVSAGIPSAELLGVGGTRTERVACGPVTPRHVQVASRQQDRPVPAFGAREPGALVQGLVGPTRPLSQQVRVVANRVLVMHLATPPPMVA